MSPTTIIEDPKRLSPPDSWPPEDGGGDEGGGGGRGDGPGPWPRESGPPLSASRLAVILFCGTVVMIFAAAVSALIILRDMEGVERAPASPEFVPSLWVSTGLIAFSSLLGILAMKKAQPDSRAAFRNLITLCFVFGLAFCASQARLWGELSSSQLTDIKSSNVNALFFLITGLHVAHVIGGIAYLATCVWRLGRGRDFGALRHFAGNCMIYWHFIGVVWLVLLAMLLP